MGNTDNSAYPLSFYFKVEFFIGPYRSELAFREVSGLAVELDMEKIERGENGLEYRLPTRIKYANMICKRSLAPLEQGVLSDWIKSSFDFRERIRPCPILVSLMDAQGNKLAAWSVTNAYPVKWEISHPDARKDELAIETLEFAYTKIERREQ